MPSFLTLVLIIGVVALAIPLAQFVMMLVQVLRIRIWPPRWTRLEHRPDLAPDEAAAVKEIEDLGFTEVSWSKLEQGPFQNACGLFRHLSQPIVAALALRPNGCAAYQVTFGSHDALGQLIITRNRMNWALLAQAQGTLSEDALAGSLAEHLKAHQARLDAGALQFGDRELEAIFDEFSTQSFAAARLAGAIVPRDQHWHPSLRAALRCVRAWMKVRRRLALPYVSPMTQGELAADFYAACYEDMEAIRRHMPMRRDVRAWLFGLTLSVFVLLWGAYAGWAQAFALAIILLLHESGHALAMRAFGYRDLTMFFVPFVGALVTGVPRDTSAWKQIVILLAGPVPGLLIGAGILVWLLFDPGLSFGSELQGVALMAIAVNAFNLLPITPLDGGQLLDVALVSRWPRGRVIFSALSVAAFLALALWLNAPATWLIALVLAFSLRSQWRTAQLHLACPAKAESRQQLRQLFAEARRHFPGQPFARQYGAIRAIVLSRRVRPARWWEAALALSIVLPFWCLIAYAALLVTQTTAATAPDVKELSAEQKAFDEAYLAETGEDDEQALRYLSALAKALAESDPRHRDYAAQEARLAKGTARDGKFLALIGSGQDGHHTTRAGLAQEWLYDLYYDSHLDPPAVRAAIMERATQRVELLLPNAFEATVHARLRLAEAIDEDGDAHRAHRMLRTLREQAQSRADCGGAYESALQAEVWQQLSHDYHEAALALVDEALAHPRECTSQAALGRLRAWVLLRSGRSEDGLTQMRKVAIARPAPANAVFRMLGLAEDTSRRAAPIDLAHALTVAGRIDEAREVIAPRSAWLCSRPADQAQSEVVAPFERERHAALRDTIRALCSSGKR